MLMPTSTTLLAGMPRVNLDHLDTPLLGFVGKEGMQLGKTPTMEASLPFTMAHLGSLSNVRQVLKHNGRTALSVLDNALRKHVVMVTSLPQQFARKFFQVPFT